MCHTVQNSYPACYYNRVKNFNGIVIYNDIVIFNVVVISYTGCNKSNNFQFYSGNGLIFVCTLFKFITKKSGLVHISLHTT